MHFVLFIASMILVEDLWFYLTHRLLHTKMLYEKIHKFHHQVSARLISSLNFFFKVATTNSNISILHASNRIYYGNYNQYLYWILGHWLSHCNIPCISSCRISQRINESQVRNQKACPGIHRPGIQSVYPRWKFQVPKSLSSRDRSH